MITTGTTSTTGGLRALMAAPSFVRLWAIGGCVNTMRWFELLSAALFTLDVTGSGLDVALVSAARTMPMLLLGAFSGVISESLNRKHVLLAGQIMACLSSGSIAVLATFGTARPWHLGVAAAVTGVVWSTEMATRRRMVGECVEGPLVSRALALDTMSNSFTRLIGPVAAGAIYQTVGIAGSYTASAVVFALAAVLVSGLRYRQDSRRLVIGQVPRDLMEGLSYARGNVTIAGVLMVTIFMNLLGFPYSALIAPIGKMVFQVSPILVGVLAASESFGAFLGGIWLTAGIPRFNGRQLMIGGSLLLMVCVILMPLVPFFPLACALLAIGGFGSSAFANMQTSLIVLHTPGRIRSRLMGLLTVCIGMGPLGILLFGGVAAFVGPMLAIDLVATVGLVCVAASGLWWTRRDKASLAAGDLRPL
jgi:MFS family permease